MREIFWNGNGMTMLTRIEREMCEHSLLRDAFESVTVSAGLVQVRNDDVVDLDHSHELGTIANDDRKPKKVK